MEFTHESSAYWPTIIKVGKFVGYNKKMQKLLRTWLLTLVPVLMSCKETVRSSDPIAAMLSETIRMAFTALVALVVGQ
jgi:hypothetical protein